MIDQRLLRERVGEAVVSIEGNEVVVQSRGGEKIIGGRGYGYVVKETN